jgi:hypothetical protein
MRFMVLILLVSCIAGCGKGSGASDKALQGCWRLERSIIHRGDQRAALTPKGDAESGVCFEPGSYRFYGGPGAPGTGTLVVKDVQGSTLHVLMDGKPTQIKVEGDVLTLGTEEEGMVSTYRRKTGS